MTYKETKREPSENKEHSQGTGQYLVLHNDDEHSFDYVIGALIEICGHDYMQALQCALITHHKGRCDVKKGKKESLLGMQAALLEKQLKVTID